MSRMRTYGLCALALVSGGQIPTEGRPRPTSYMLDITNLPDSAEIAASAVVTFAEELLPADSLVFFLHGELRVIGASAGGSTLRCTEKRVFFEAEYSLVADRVACIGWPVGATSIEIAYRGRFGPSAARWKSDYYRIEHDGLYLRGSSNSYWFPTFSASDSGYPIAPLFRARLRAPKAYTSIMNGEYVGRQVIGDTAVDEWKVEGIRYVDLQYTARRYARFDAPGVVAFALRDSGSMAAAERLAQTASKLARRYAAAYRSNVSGGTTHFVIERPKYGQISSANVSGMTEEEWQAFTVASSSAATMAHEMVHAYVRLETPAGDPPYPLATEGTASYFHIPVLGSLRGPTAYADWMNRVQGRYVRRLAPRYTDWAGELPPNKPLTSIQASEIGRYKDRFLLADRSLLFWDYLRRQMGADFDIWIKEIMNAPEMTLTTFLASLGRRSPALERDARIWLTTIEYPDRFRRTTQ